MIVKQCPVCGFEFEAYNEKTPCPNCVYERKKRESQFEKDRGKLERLYAEWNELCQTGASDEECFAKKKEYNDWKRSMLEEYGTISIF